MATDTVTSPELLASGNTKVFKNFIDGEWVASSTGETFENRNPADTREVVGIFQKSGKDDVDAAVEAAEARFRKVAPGAGPAPRRDRLPRRRNAARAQGRILPRHDPRDGQGPQGNARRHPGSHRHRLLHGRRRPPPVRAHHAFRAAQQVRHGGAAPDRRLRHDHAVEFSHGDPFVEASARDRLRQHLRDQAGAGHAALHLQPGAHAGRCGRAQGRDQHRQPDSDPSVGATADRASRCARHLADRIDCRRPHRRHHRRQELQTLLARTGRQESHDRARRRQPRSRHRRRPVGRASARPASAAPPPAASSCRKASIANSWSATSTAPRR